MYALRCRTPSLSGIYFRHYQLSKYAFCANQTKETQEEYPDIKTEQEMPKKQNYTFWGTLLFGSVIVIGISSIIFKQSIEQNKIDTSPIPTYQKPTNDKYIGQGEWNMVDQDKNKINNTSLLGKYQMVYFGFTYCPDVCPRELTKISDALSLLENKGFETGKDIIPIFVSVDPKRDTPDVLKKYLSQYHPKIMGLTGSPQETQKIAHAYKAYYSLRNETNINLDDDYYVDHSSITYIMSPHGEWLGHISVIDDAQAMAEKTCVMIKESGGKVPYNGLLQKLFG